MIPPHFKRLILGEPVLGKKECTVEIHKPNVDEKLFFFLSGVITSVPLTLFFAQLASVFLSGMDAFLASLVSAAGFTPLIEEFAKAFPIFYRHGETERSIFSLALFVGLGFGVVEMLTYTFVLGANPVGRLPGLFFHPASTSIIAYGVARRKPIQYYLVAVFLHFAHNLLVLISPGLPFSGVITAITVFMSWQLYNRTQEKFID